MPSHSPSISAPQSTAGAATSAASSSSSSASTADACAAFQRFYNDLNTHGSVAVGQLLPEAQAVQQAASDSADFGDAAAADFFDDANALLAYVEQPDFATTGTVSADPVQEMAQDCS